MNYCLTFAIFLVSLTGFCQQDSLVITTPISVDSLYAFNRKLDFLQVNDTVLRMKIDRNITLDDGKLVIYSGQKKYETSLSTDPVSTFHYEWSARDPQNALTIRMSIKKGSWVVSTADGSAVHMGSSLSAYGPSGDLILEESYGVVVQPIKKKPNGKRKKT